MIILISINFNSYVAVISLKYFKNVPGSDMCKFNTYATFCHMFVNIYTFLIIKFSFLIVINVKSLQLITLLIFSILIIIYFNVIYYINLID